MTPAETSLTDNDNAGPSSIASDLAGLGNNDRGLRVGPDIPFIELGGAGGGGGLLSKIAGALGVF